MLSDDKETTKAMHKSSDDPKPLNQTRKTVPAERNKFTRLAVKQSPCFGLQLDASKADRAHNLIGLFGEPGLIDLL